MQESPSVCYFSVDLSLNLSSVLDNLDADERDHSVLRKFHLKSIVNVRLGWSPIKEVRNSVACTATEMIPTIEMIPVTEMTLNHHRNDPHHRNDTYSQSN